MNQDYYRFIVSPETVISDIAKVTVSGQTFGVYSGMSQMVTSGPRFTSLFTGLTVNFLLNQTTIDEGYYSPFDGFVLQKNVVANFIFSSTTQEPYKWYVYNTSDEFQKFLDLSSYTIDWGDGTPKQTITNYAPNSINHTYPSAVKEYTIVMEQRNPWGVTKVQKTIHTPYVNVPIPNPKGEIYFTTLDGNWLKTPISYDYIFSGDAVNIVSAQTSNNYVVVPFTISGLTKSRLTELQIYGTVPLTAPLFNEKYQLGVPIIANGQIWGVVTNAELNVFTAYTIQDVNYYDYQDGTTIFFEESSGLTTSNLTAVPITKEEVLIKVVDQPNIQTNVFVERGKNSAYERVQRLGEVDNLGDMINYGYGFFNVVNKTNGEV